jgi:hypothetical protein
MRSRPGAACKEAQDHEQGTDFLDNGASSAGIGPRHPGPELEQAMDKYTKVVLTLIAVALSIIALRDVGVPIPAFAQSGIVQVKICGLEANRRVNNAGGCAHVFTDGNGFRHVVVAQ